jgi:asparagine synthase (glutamine-hydrolysing)
VPLVDDALDRHAAIYWDNSLDDQVNRMCLADSRMFMTGLNLTYTDRASMAASMEVRTPFVDRFVFDAAFTFDGHAKIRRGQQKLPLKQAAEAWLPREIIHRRKASFSAPLRAWISRDLADVIGDTLCGGELVDTGVIAADALTRMVDLDRSGAADYSKQLWQLLTMELWYRQARATTATASRPLVPELEVISG